MARAVTTAYPLVSLDTEGYGKPGWCKVCASSLAPDINRHFSNKESISSVARWLREIDFPISRLTLTKHLNHGTDPKSTFVEAARKKGPIKTTTTSEFLQTVMDAGAARVEKNPDSVSIDHALRAAQIVEARKDNSRDGIKILILALTGQPAPDTIRGQFQVVTEKE